MGRPCSVCLHEYRQAIDEALVRGEPNRAVARQHGVSKDAVARHREHVGRALVAVQRRREAQGAETLIDRVERLYGRASAILDAAEAEGRATVALGAVRELRGIVETLGKLTGELDERPSVGVVNVIASPDWMRVRGAVLEALLPYPEARAAVAGRLLQLEERAS